MENYQGDLADIIRASGGITSDNIGGGGSSTSGEVAAVSDWQFQSDPMNYPPGIEDPTDDFGHPFSNLRDPLLHELDISNSSFFNSSSLEDIGGFGGGGNFEEEMKIRPCNIFSKMLQISPVLQCDSPMVAASPRGLKAPTALISNDIISANTSKGCFIENTGVHISSSRNTGIKRRKSQAKKVVCIPAPPPANSRPTGEIVPSDLWAWRKYGQKPIKGSPYPRGYYRCSSSKGCSARKQVERSRTDPNMLVITYTSEHNHPWPTQRNALAGSTRSQPSKNNSSSSSSKNISPASQPPKVKEEEKENNSTTATPVKEEEMEDITTDKQIEMDDGDQFSEGYTDQSYRPALPQSNNNAEDFFADLGEIEGDPLSLLFTQGFSADEERGNNKDLDPFSFYDWSGNNNPTFGEAKRAL